MDQEKDSSKCTNPKCKCTTCTCGSGCTCNVSNEVVCDPCKDFKAEMLKKEQKGSESEKTSGKWLKWLLYTPECTVTKWVFINLFLPLIKK